LPQTPPIEIPGYASGQSLGGKFWSLPKKLTLIITSLKFKEIQVTYPLGNVKYPKASKHQCWHAPKKEKKILGKIDRTCLTGVMCHGVF
jgi:hypothetical protein